MHSLSDKEIFAASIEKSEPASPSSSTYSNNDLNNALNNAEKSEPQGPASRSFFGAIAGKFRNRSRSPSPLPSGAATPRASTPIPRSPKKSRETTPMAQPSTMPTYAHRSSSSASTATTSSTTSHYSNAAPSMKRISTDKSDFERMSYGRHSGDWIFNGVSFTNSLKTAFNRRSNS